MQTKDMISAYNALTPAEQAVFQKQTGLILKPKSTKFQRTNIIVSCEANAETYTQSDIYKMLVESGQFSKNCVDSCIADYRFDGNPNQSYAGCAGVSGIVDKFINDIIQRDIIAEGQIFETYLQVNLLQGALLAIELVKSGAVNEKGKGIIIYLTETINGISSRLGVWNLDNNKVGVSLHDVYLNGECDAGNGVLSGN